MMLHSYAPKTKHPPMLYVRWTWHKELGMPWEKVGIRDNEIPHLAELVNLKIQADNLKSRKGKGAKGAPPTI